MKKEIQNQIITELTNVFFGKEIQLNVTVERIDKNKEKVTISYENENDENPKELISKETKNGFAWVASLILTISKIKWISTNVLIFNDGQRYNELT